MPSKRRVRLFTVGADQAVPIPMDFELAGEEAVLKKEGQCLILEPAYPTSLMELLDRLRPIDEDFGPTPDPPPEPVD